MSIPSVNITIADNGANTSLQLPLQNVQVVIGCAIGGTVNVPYATTLATKLQSQFTAGPLVEAGGLVCAAGGTVIAVSAPIVTHGSAKSVQFTGTGTSAITTTLDATNGAWDDAFVVFKVVSGGTIGVSGIQFQISYDAGRHYGPTLNLGTANTYALTNLGVTLNFAAGTLVAGDVAQFQTIAPQWNVAGIQAALAALAASAYALSGWGSMHIVGPCSASDAATINTTIDNLRTQYVFTRTFLEARDAAAPTAWGGSGETESAWMTSVETAFSATAATRIVVAAGHYNTPSAFPNTIVGTPSFRRNAAWPCAVRRIGVPPQFTTWRVRDGSLINIAVDPTKDPSDGFIYHDERVTPGLDAARFLSLRTWPLKQGFYCTKDNLMSGVGSQYTILPYGNVIDIASQIGYQTGVEVVGDILRIKPNGRLDSNDALTIQNMIQQAIDANMTNVGMISSAVVAVDQTANVQSTGDIPVAITITQKVAANSVSETIGLSIPFSAPTGTGR